MKTYSKALNECIESSTAILGVTQSSSIYWTSNRYSVAVLIPMIILMNDRLEEVALLTDYKQDETFT